MFSNMRLAWRLAFSFSLLLALMVVSTLVGLVALDRAQEELATIVNRDSARTQLANHMIDNARTSAITVRSLLLANYLKDGIGSTRSRITPLDEVRTAYNRDLLAFRNLVERTDPKALALLDQMEASAKIVVRNQDSVIEMANAGRLDDAVQSMFAVAYPSVQQWIADIDSLITYQDRLTQTNFEEAEADYTRTRTLMIVIGIVATLLTAGLAFLLTASIDGPLSLVTKMIVSRDLSVDVSAFKKRRDEVGLMITSFSGMVELIAQQLRSVREGSSALASAASEILVATTQVASGTAEISSAINETATTVEEVRQAAQLSSQKAHNVSDSAQRVAQAFQTGQKSVDETAANMNRIREQMETIAQSIIRLSEQGQSIGGIIASVTDLADQSNLLAVNAAIEAAKAGEQGRGFAVVAQEIKSLAEQSKQATAQVRAILSDVQKATSNAVMATEQGSRAVEAGVEQASTSGEAISDLAATSGEAVQAAIQILASSQQQVIGMNQIGLAMENINQAGSQNAASMRQMEVAAQNLHELGKKLKSLVEQFKV